MTKQVAEKAASRLLEVAQIDGERLRIMLGHFKQFMSPAKTDYNYRQDDDTGAISIDITVEKDSGISALSAVIAALEAAAEKREVHLFIQKVSVKQQSSKKNKTYSIRVEGICH